MNHPDFTQKTLTRDGGRIVYWHNQRPDKPALMLLHGAGMDHHLFEQQWPAFNADHHVIVWDARGHGLSRPSFGRLGLARWVQDVLAVLDDLARPQAVLVGQSLGGLIAQKTAYIAPNRIQGLFTIGTPPLMLPYPNREILSLRMSLPMLKLWPWSHLVKTVAHGVAHTPRAQADAARAFGQLSKREFLRIWSGVTRAMRAEGLPDYPWHIPMSLCYGVFDQLGSVAEANQRLHRARPDIELNIISKANHNANLDNPEAVNALLSAFLQRIKA